jgi:hypothetical protein
MKAHSCNGDELFFSTITLTHGFSLYFGAFPANLVNLSIVILYANQICLFLHLQHTHPFVPVSSGRFPRMGITWQFGDRGRIKVDQL